MKVDASNFGGGIEILASDDFQAIPIQLQIVSNPSVVKAGTPLTADGAVALDGTNAVGLLLNDVDTAVNPNGALLVDGIVDYAKAKANAGITASAATLDSAIKGIYFRTNIGVNATISLSKTSLAVTGTGTDTATISNAVGTVTAVSSDTDVATAAVSGTTLTVTGVAAGTAVITLTDGYGNSTTATAVVTAAVVG